VEREREREREGERVWVTNQRGGRRGEEVVRDPRTKLEWKRGVI
jgi:hypothetical protein